MELWGARLYGDPCAQCAWSWPADPAVSIDYVRDLPGQYAQLLSGRSGTQRHPELSWSVTGYVCHVGDNLHQWAEGVVGVLRGGDPHVGGYDPDTLAAARRYGQVSLAGALWSLERSAASWVRVLTDAVDVDVTLLHPTRGQQRAQDIVGNNAHDAHHHGWDITRSLTG